MRPELSSKHWKFLVRFNRPEKMGRIDSRGVFEDDVGTMKQAIFLAALALCSGFSGLSQVEKGVSMSAHASGPFEVKLAPQEDATEPSINRMTIDKQFHGPLEATSKGIMLAAGTAVKGSAGYVALEVVTGTLDGHKGSFILQHTGTMARGTPQLAITVVPDSATGELTGLTGKMTIDIAGDKHTYNFDYMLPASH
jgi:hypothetical protein